MPFHELKRLVQPAPSSRKEYQHPRNPHCATSQAVLFPLPGDHHANFFYACALSHLGPLPPQILTTLLILLYSFPCISLFAHHTSTQILLIKKKKKKTTLCFRWLVIYCFPSTSYNLSAEEPESLHGQIFPQFGLCRFQTHAQLNCISVFLCC